MKKFIYALTAVIMLSLSVNTTMAAETKSPAKELTAEQKVQVEQIQRRVEEIRDMDKSNLTRQERKELRKELKEMKAQANAVSGGGVYLSVGAIIIIILLLILIL
jgi:TolA-binding protein